MTSKKTPSLRRRASRAARTRATDSLWYQDAVVYELRVRSFYDADGDGIGDFRGLTEKLDYLQDLGVDTIWLLPFYPSPLRDDGYDIADYLSVHESVGTMRDLKEFLREAHARRLRVITELVINHTSDQHPWFQRARSSPPGSRWRNFYVWSDDAAAYADARIIFTDYETSNWTWDPVAKQYYWHRFFSHQPDLNFDNPEVCEAVMSVMDYWLELGVDGLRLDAIPYLFEREGTACENLPETHTFLKKLRAHIDGRFRDRMLLAEANQWPEDAVSYFGEGDECHMAFHFPIMPRLYMALRMEDHHPILDILEQTPQIPEGCQWAIFLRNHDELTLEMVTEEERDYMVKAYASDPQARINLGIRRRLAPLLGNNRKRIELMNALLFSLPGTPVLYYGDEIGMGDNVYLGDRNGVRTPMQWSPDRNSGFSRANPQRLFLPPIVDPEYHYEAINVETQQANPSSLLWWTKRLIALRRQYIAFGRGQFEPLRIANRRVLAFLRRYDGQVLLVVANLSRFAQPVELDLKEFAGSLPRELFGQVEFPPIPEQPYLLTLGPHGFFWFKLERPHAETAVATREERPWIEVEGSWLEAFAGTGRGHSLLERALARHMERQPWFPRMRRVKQLHARAVFALGDALSEPRLVVADVIRDEGEAETHVVPLMFSEGATSTGEVVARVRVSAEGGVLEGAILDAYRDSELVARLLGVVDGRRRIRHGSYELRGVPVRGAEKLALSAGVAATPLRVRSQGITFAVGDELMVKLLHRLEGGESPEVELLRKLADARRCLVPRVVGHVQVAHGRDEPSTLLVVESLVASRRDAWSSTLDEVQRFFERVLTWDGESISPTEYAHPIELIGKLAPPSEAELIGGYREVMRTLGRRTAELHLALAAVEDPAFAPQRWTLLDRRPLYQSMRGLSKRALGLLRAGDTVPDTAAELAAALLSRERELEACLKRALEQTPSGRRIRVHSDFHLESVLLTGQEPIIVDFVGDPGKTLAERRRKRSPLIDVAALLRSVHDAAFASLSGQVPGTLVRPGDVAHLEPWARSWYGWMAAAFIEAYRGLLSGTDLVPATDEGFAFHLDLRLLERGLLDVIRDLEQRPSWVAIPLRNLLDVLDARCESDA